MTLSEHADSQAGDPVTDQDRELARLALSSLEVVVSAQLTIASVERGTFDESYIEFLDEQIFLGAQGPEWTARLQARREGLARWTDCPLLTIRAENTSAQFTVEVDPNSGKVVHWERY